MAFSFSSFFLCRSAALTFFSSLHLESQVSKKGASTRGRAELEIASLGTDDILAPLWILAHPPKFKFPPSPWPLHIFSFLVVLGLPRPSLPSPWRSWHRRVTICVPSIFGEAIIPAWIGMGLAGWQVLRYLQLSRNAPANSWPLYAIEVIT